MLSLNPIVADLVVSPIDRTAANPSISFGGDAINNSGTGIYGTFGQINFALSSLNRLSLTTSGLNTSADFNINSTLGNVVMNSGITSGAFIPPRLTTTQRDAILGVKGMIIYNTTDDVHQAYNGAWVDMYA